MHTFGNITIEHIEKQVSKGQFMPSIAMHTYYVRIYIYSIKILQIHMRVSSVSSNLMCMLGLLS